VVREFLGRPSRCGGGTPTVFNTDTIRIVVRDAASHVDLRLDGGPFVPGATPEAEGAPEIEVEFVGGFAVGGNVVGTPRGDEFHWGPARAQAGLNLNPKNAGDSDVDVTVSSRDAILVAQGGAGNDTIIPAPGVAIRNEELTFAEGGRGHDLLAATRGSSGSLEGGRGNDVLRGNRWFDHLEGGPGDDRIDGAGRSDQIDGGPGRDLLLGGGGRDRIKARDSSRDVVRCGPGRDRVGVDRRDRLRGCEVIRRRP
jgi:hypothetical protein